jgi:hypothetical protein
VVRVRVRVRVRVQALDPPLCTRVVDAAGVVETRPPQGGTLGRPLAPAYRPKALNRYSQISLRVGNDGMA